jgi:hypothetical protein
MDRGKYTPKAKGIEAALAPAKKVVVSNFDVAMADEARPEIVRELCK